MQTETKSRYTTDDLLTKSFLLRSISDRVIEEELSILISQLVDPVISRFADEIRRTADEIAQLDLDSSFALLALRQSYTRPEILDGESAVLDIVDGRHPVLDKMFSSLEDDNECIRHFTPNSLNLTSPSSNLSNYSLLLPVFIIICVSRVLVVDGPEHGRKEHISPSKRADPFDGSVRLICPRFPLLFHPARCHFHSRKQIHLNPTLTSPLFCMYIDWCVR